MRFRTPGLLAVLAVGLVFAAPIQKNGWNETAHYALIQSLADGEVFIDDHVDNAETYDKVKIDGHLSLIHI